MITYESDFDWSLTERKISVFIPNYKRKKYLLQTIPAISTIIPKDQWIIVAVNDGIHEDLSELNKFNFTYFTLHRQSINFRTTANVRNYFIKHTRSPLLFQTEPDVLIKGDFLNNFMLARKPYRIGNHAYLGPLATKKFINNINIDINKLKKYPKTSIGKTSSHSVWYFHHGYGIDPVILRNIHGYDEDFKKYGCEDADIFDRLKSLKISFYMDSSCTSIHLWHNRPNKIELKHSKKIRESKKKNFTIVRNKNKWGEG